MPEVCLVGDEEVKLRYQLLSHETARNALSSYDLSTPFFNTVSLETVSLGGAVSVINDLDWYITRYVRTAIVHDESVSDEHYLSRDLATAIRNDEIDPDETDQYLKIYGLEYPTPTTDDSADPTDVSADDPTDVSADVSADDSTDDPADDSTDDPTAGSTAHGDSNGSSESNSPVDDNSISVPPRLVEPLYVTGTGESLPTYDLRDVQDTLIVRVTSEEFSRAE